MPSKLIKLKATYNKNCLKSIQLCTEMQELVALIKKNVSKEQFFQYKYNKETLKVLNTKIEGLWDRQLDLLEEINAFNKTLSSNECLHLSEEFKTAVKLGLRPPRKFISPNAKLNEDNVQLIRDSTLSLEVLSTRYKVSVQCIKDIKSGRTWKSDQQIAA